jgi:hypothetical protein
LPPQQSPVRLRLRRVCIVPAASPNTLTTC